MLLERAIHITLLDLIVVKMERVLRQMRMDFILT